MSDHRDEDSYSVTPIRVGAGGSRIARGRRRLGMLVVLLASLGIIGVALVGPRLSQPPNLDVAYFATPTPSPTPTPTPTPTVTPLPTITIGDSGGLRGQLPILSDSFRTLDLATGLQSAGHGLNVGADAVFGAPGGAGWICICSSETSNDTGVVRDIDLIRLGQDGREEDRVTLVTLTSDVLPDGPSPIQTDVAVAPDGRSALLAVGLSSKAVWRYSAARIDLVAGSIGRFASLGEMRIPKTPPQTSTNPGATPLPVRTDLSGPMLRRSPDGRSAIAWASLQQYTDEAQLGQESFGWRIALDADGSIVHTAVLKALAGMPQYCTSAAFLSDDRFVSICPDPDPNAMNGERQPWIWFELDASGAVTRQELPGARMWYSDPLFDRANGAVWLWDGVDLNLVRVSDHGRQIDSRQFSSPDPTEGDRSIASLPPDWARPWSSVSGQYQTPVAGSPDGRRLYLLAWDESSRTDTRQQGSRGVIVVDPTTFAIVDHWAPEANYWSLQVVLDGSAVAVAGAPQFDAGGRSVPWESSLTLHDATDGRVLARYGRLGENWYPFFVPSMS